jgi:beta-mannanase
MNGDWMAWGGAEGNSPGRGDGPAKYVAVWRHVWNIFEQVGANENVIWLYCPSRIDKILKVKYVTSVAEDYPGDQYVDWIGATIYWRKTDQPLDYTGSFGMTVGQLRGVTDKPLFFPEIGAIQSDHGTDLSAAKQQWIRNTIQGFLADPTVVGFTWFNNVASPADDPGNPRDWRFDADPDTLTPFSQLTAVPQFAGGTMPDPTGK